VSPSFLGVVEYGAVLTKRFPRNPSCRGDEKGVYFDRLGLSEKITVRVARNKFFDVIVFS
jgi:hypothetical protein